MIGLTYVHVPTAVNSAHVLTWQDRRSPVELQPPGEIVRESNTARVECTSGANVIVSFERADGTYLVDGPFVCPPNDGERPLDLTWRRTLHLRVPLGLSAHPDVSWVSATADTVDGWPRCAWTRGTAECWGTTVDARGALIFTDGDRVWWSLVTGSAPVRDFQASGWARLIRINAGADAGNVVAAIVGPVTSPERRASLRLDTARVASAHAISIASGGVWVHGEQTAASAWIEIRTPAAAPLYLPLDEVVHGPPALPLWVTLDPPRRLDGVVRGAQGTGAGAIVTLFRLIDPLPARPDQHPQPRRVLADETRADATGEFQFDALGDADYELVAWHPQFGRGVAAVARGDTSVTVRLELAGQVRGRVMAGRTPLAGVDVISLPDPGAFAQTADLTELKGGDGRTGQDGRFVVSLASGGGGEVRVGGGRYPIRRFSLPSVPLPLVDLGDIDLGSAIEMTMVLDRDPGCDIRATGPVGRSGLQVIVGTRTGPGLFTIVFPEEGSWEVHLLCGRDEHALAPSLLAITQANSGKEVRLLIR
jgi:hypothetical protein